MFVDGNIVPCMVSLSHFYSLDLLPTQPEASIGLCVCVCWGEVGKRRN